jgi:hypothetical protein
MKYFTTKKTILLGTLGLIVGVIFWISYSSQKSQNPWLYYHKPEFSGLLIDYDTKQPIEGAVAEVLYFRVDLISFGAGHADEIFKISETLTDKNGKFYFPDFTTWFSPFWAGERVKFKFYKPGYVSADNSDDPHFTYMRPEEYEYNWYVNKNQKIKTHGGIIELSKLESKENRIIALDEAVPDFEQQKLLTKIINEEISNLGLSPIKPNRQVQ